MLQCKHSKIKIYSSNTLIKFVNKAHLTIIRQPQSLNNHKMLANKIFTNLVYLGLIQKKLQNKQPSSLILKFINFA